MGIVHRMIVAIEVFSREPIHFRSAAELEFALSDGTAIGAVSVKTNDLFTDGEALEIMGEMRVDHSALKLDPTTDSLTPGESDRVVIRTEYGIFSFPEARVAMLAAHGGGLRRTVLGVGEDVDTGVYSPETTQYCSGVLFGGAGIDQLAAAIILTSDKANVLPRSATKKALLIAFDDKRGAADAINLGMSFGKGEFGGVARARYTR